MSSVKLSAENVRWEHEATQRLIVVSPPAVDKMVDTDCFILMLCVYFSRMFVFFLFREETLISQNQYGLVNY